MAIREKRTAIQVAGGAEISATIVAPETLLPGILFVHGWGGSQDRYLARAREIAELGCVCLTFDLSGHAGTRPRFETVTRENNLQDLMAAYDLLVSQPNVDPAQIAVVGSSYGGYLAAILTSLRPVEWLALRVPALYVDSGWEMPKLQLRKEQNLEAYRQTVVHALENRALLACSQFTGDVLLVQSEFDHLIPPAVISNYREACVQARSLTYRMMRGANHGLTEHSMSRAYTTLLFNWLREMMFGPQKSTQPVPVSATGG
ncbi:MAG TPA: alpha/beta fold hydrolase [Lautropia sp.]|jgi:dienelactone hydrolase|nr:alpha/beta fold hydrolase [Lautropia sp.]